jgi:hypothetical protein
MLMLPFGGQSINEMLDNPETINWDIMTWEERVSIQNMLLREMYG